MRRVIITILTTIMAISLNAQEADVIVSDKQNADNSKTITAQTIGHGSFTVWLEIVNMINTTTPDRIVIKKINGDDNLLTLQPTIKSKPAAVEYSYTWVQGEVNAEPTEGFIYSLPVRPRVKVAVKNLTPANVGLSRANLSGFNALCLLTDEGEDIRPMREGMVIKVQRGNDALSPATITIEHKDGTQAEYSNIHHATVMSGEVVTASTSLGQAGVMDSHRSGISIILYRYIDNQNRLRFPQMKVTMDMLNPVFATKQGNIALEDGGEYEAATNNTTKKEVRCRWFRKCK